MKIRVRARTLRAALAGLIVAAGCLAGLGRSLVAQEAAGSAVRAVLFYSPTCPHCHEVIQEHLPPIFANHGGTPRVWSFEGQGPEDPVVHYASNGELVILLVDTTRPAGAMLYQGSVGAFNVPSDRLGVPQLVVGNTVLVGSFEIPDQLPALIREGADSGGLGWPAIDGLPEFVIGVEAEIRNALAAEAEAEAADETADAADVETVAEPAGEEPRVDDPAATEPPVADVEPVPEAAGEEPAGERPEVEATPGEGEPAESEQDPGATEPRVAPEQGALESVSGEDASMLDRFRRDVTGNGLAVLVLLVMIVTIGVTIGRLRMGPEPGSRVSPAVPLLGVLGLLVAVYLTYVETQGAAAVCGPVGDCNTVQQSEFAWLFGVIPIGVLGLVGYSAILLAWLVARTSSGTTADWAALGLHVVAFAGTLFSVYLTFLEPFVIGATCAWCLISAILITAIMWLSARTARNAWARLHPA